MADLRQGAYPESPTPEWESICQALIDVVVERGYVEATIEEVVERAGTDRATFDRYFEDKEDCYVQTYWKYVVAVFERHVFDAYARESSWRDGLRASAYEAARFIRDYPRESRFGSVEMFGAGTMAQVHRERQLQRIVDMIDAGRQELDDPDSIDRAVAEGVLGSIYTMAVRGVNEGGFEAIERYVPELMYLAVRPYLGHEVAREELTMPVPPPHPGRHGP